VRDRVSKQCRERKHCHKGHRKNKSGHCIKV
jgi:hypothetical protein